MSQMWRKIAETNGAELHRQAVGKYSVQVTDEFLTPMVTVTAQDGKSSKFALASIGLYFHDGVNKFYREATDEELSAGELNDLAIEHFLGGAQ